MITDPYQAINKALVDLVHDLPSDTDHTLTPAKIFAELKRQDLLKVVFPDGGETLVALIKMVSLLSCSTIQDAQKRHFRLHRGGSANGVQFTVKFPFAVKSQTDPQKI